MNQGHLRPETQTWIEVTNKLEGTIFVDPCQLSYPNNMCVSSSGVADVRSDQQFKILVANFNYRKVDLLPHQVVATKSAHTETLVESYL